MTRVIVLLLVFVGVSAPTEAQGLSIDRAARDGLAWPAADQRAADWISTGLVAAAVVAPCVDRSTRECWLNQALHVGVAAGAAELAKRVHPRTRPNAHDQKSFFSQHTAIACAAVNGSKFWPVCPVVGYLRIAANWHWATDVLAGAAAGSLTLAIRW